MTHRERRAVPRVHYSLLEAGLSPSFAKAVIQQSCEQLNPTTEFQDSKPPVRSPLSVPDHPDALRSALAAAKAENEELLRSSQLKTLQQQNAKLKEQLSEDPPPSLPLPANPLTVQDVRALPELSSRVESKLQQLGLSDSSSGSEDSDDYKHGHKKETKKRGKKLRSGKTAKITSQVVNPQIWPHSALSLSYVSKEVSYDNLNLAEFAAGYASILRLPRLTATERSARIEHFATLMYLATQFPWPVVRSLHAAALFEIECGRLCWGDSFAHLEARLLHGASHSTRASTASTSKQSATVHFCKAFQTGKCNHYKGSLWSHTQRAQMGAMHLREVSPY